MASQHLSFATDTKLYALHHVAQLRRSALYCYLTPSSMRNNVLLALLFCALTAPCSASGGDVELSDEEMIDA
eukprot:2985463-Amphidinium_carterae.1